MRTEGAGSLVIARGDLSIVLRPEQERDAPFLERLFRSVAGGHLALMPIDDATKDRLVRMQYASQTTTYRTRFPDACFDIIEQEGQPVGRIVVDRGLDVGRIVDIALMPERRACGLGTAIVTAVTERFARCGQRVQCQVLAGNHASLRMFRRAGFRQVADDPPFLHLEWQPALDGPA
jgi:ribosomal protein S18 acetylase RimI-like enzyme